MDLGTKNMLSTNLKTPLAANDQFQFFANFDTREIEICHNNITYLKEKWKDIPLRFVPAVCTRTNNECEVHLLSYSHLKHIIDS
ncbi:hypothetical protein RFI_11269 [Reticulomyxa filosa]|uniref:Uncharacterized protein n=1 Tax=Reticulomyxa filosa TaxID=46433 RepID=X6NJ15_RETFI|nr:hypothetical protein RFI_11269 [Reticulomyxa filosa]|eukprot:ETO25868.1 hypothetical protein RFI_11269 [Reticulomyxa filosa]